MIMRFFRRCSSLWIFFVVLFQVKSQEIDNDDSYYDGDQQEPVHVSLIQTIDCSNECPPHWTEPIIQQKQTLVYPTSASVSLKCPYEAKPTATIIWFKDGQIFSPELYDLFSVDQFYFNISKVTMYDSGSYTCVVENHLGNLTRSFQLIVQGRSLDRPVFTSKAKNFTKYEGDNVTMECLFYSDSSPYVQWFIHRNLLKNLSKSDWPKELEFLKEYNPHTMSEDDVKLLTIRNLRRNDTGAYICRVLNEYGFTDLIHFLNVLPVSQRFVEKKILNRFSDEFILIVAILIGVLLIVFIIFLIYHFRHEKTLRRTLLATRILATRGISNLKNNQLYRSDIDPKTKFPLIDDVNRIYQTDGTISSYFDDQFEIPFEKLFIGRLIGKGAFGFVYQGTTTGIDSKEKEKTVAIKTVRDDATIDEIENLLKEFTVMKMVGQHPNIISLIGSCRKGEKLLLVVEYAKFGNLRDYLREKRPPGHVLSASFESPIDVDRDEPEPLLHDGSDDSDRTLSINDLIEFSLQIAQGMEYLHTKKCIHRDLAARNVLLAENRICKIADFGLARDLTQTYYYRKQTDGRVPVKWMSPEALFDRRFSTKSDVWSFAILTWEIMSYGGTPYPSIAAEKLFDYLRDGNRMSQPVHCPNEIFQLIESCWIFKEALRPTFQQICEYLRQYLNRITPIDYSDLDYVDLPARSSTSISDFVCPVVHPTSSSGIATDSNSHSHVTSVTTTTTTSSSSLS